MTGELILHRPILSVVVCVVSDDKHLEGCLGALSRQVDPPTMEIIVPYLSQNEEIKSLQFRFPDAKFYPVQKFRSNAKHSGASHSLYNELRAIGLGLAKGDIVSLIEDHGRADKHWSKRIIEAHKSNHAAIGGAIENEVDHSLNWAVFFCDFGRYQNPLHPGPTRYISDANVSYKRKAIEGIRTVWQDSFHEPITNSALLAKGETLWLRPDIIVYQHRENLRLLSAIRERYFWGRFYAGNQVQHFPWFRKLVQITFSPILPILLILRKFNEVRKKGRLMKEFLKASPLIFILLIFWSCGELIGFLTGRPTTEE